MTVSPQLLAILVCPKCKKDLEYREAESALLCHNCKLRYPIRDGIPIMLVEEARPLDDSECVPAEVRADDQ